MPKLRIIPSQDYDFKSSFYSLSIRYHEKSTEITMYVPGDRVHTGKFPSTVAILERQLPSIFSSVCFNKSHFPFREEVKRTELGHLFEHALLEYLSDIKLQNESYTGAHSGITTWDWNSEAKGMFHITIDSGIDDRDNFFFALKKTISLMNILMSQGPQEKARYMVPSFTSHFSFPD